jgi:hypothetical protein
VTRDKDSGIVNDPNDTGNRQLTTGNLSKSQNKPALLWFGAPKPAGKPKPGRAARPCDPRLVSAARELRDRWLERVNDEGVAPATGKYLVTRTLAAPAAPAELLLPNAA